MVSEWKQSTFQPNLHPLHPNADRVILENMTLIYKACVCANDNHIGQWINQISLFM